MLKRKWQQLSIAAVILLAGCATPWVPVKQAEVWDANHQLHFTPPDNWMQFNGPTTSAQNWRYTRDGFFLQELTVGYDEPQNILRNVLGLPAIKVEMKLADDLTPIETADLVFAEMRRLQNQATLELIEKSAVKVGGEDGFKLVYRWKNSKGLPYQMELRGTAKQNKLFLASYASVAKNFWARDYGVFEQVAKSASLKG